MRHLLFPLLLLPVLATAAGPYSDHRHDSKVFGEPRNYRLFLPQGYETSGKRYPVIYYFHGHSDRYTVDSRIYLAWTPGFMLRAMEQADAVP